MLKKITIYDKSRKDTTAAINIWCLRQRKVWNDNFLNLRKYMCYCAMYINIM